MKKIYMGIDIGGTAVKLGLVREDGEILARMEQSVSFDGYQTPVLTTVLLAAEKFLKENQTPGGVLAETMPVGIGVSATGQVDSNEGVIAGTGGNMPGWEGSVVGPALKEKFNLPVTVANDANCMCLGEKWLGAAKDCNDFIGITIGTGIGGGIFTGGKILEGSRGLGGELGHFMTHARDGVSCTCKNRGCYERYAATTALVRRAKEADPELIDGRHIFARAEAGDEMVLKLIEDWIEEIAAGLIGLIHIFNPEMVLIGGGVSSQQKLLIDPLAKKVKEGVMPAFAKNLTIRSAALNNDAGLAGAVYYYIQKNIL
ncbi:MAG: ROK family protein [Lachnospiraceae bacterium]|nr:ROK family protein [Lachnospiraceae bacterium]